MSHIKATEAVLIGRTLRHGIALVLWGAFLLFNLLTCLLEQGDDVRFEGAFIAEVAGVAGDRGRGGRVALL